MTKRAKPEPQASSKGRKKTAQGNALGIAAKEDQSPEGVKLDGWPIATLGELHAPFPHQHESGLVADRIRVKRKPSLGERGFHARTNPEAIGSGLP